MAISYHRKRAILTIINGKYYPCLAYHITFRHFLLVYWLYGRRIVEKVLVVQEQ